jgi:hypothetical protein
VLFTLLHSIVSFPVQEDWTSSLMYVDYSSSCIVDDCKQTNESILIFLSLPTFYYFCAPYIIQLKPCVRLHIVHN